MWDLIKGFGEIRIYLATRFICQNLQHPYNIWHIPTSEYRHPVCECRQCRRQSSDCCLDDMFYL